MIIIPMRKIKNVTFDGAVTSHKEKYKGNNYLPFRHLARPVILNLIKYILPACFFLALNPAPALARNDKSEQEQD